jgi:hypothetical protein
MLPREICGQCSIMYVDPRMRAASRAFVDEPIELPR